MGGPVAEPVAGRSGAVGYSVADTPVLTPMKGPLMLTSSISRRAIAPALAVALVAGAAPVATAAPATDTEAATDQASGQEKQSSGPGSSEFTQDETDNAKRFAGLLAGILAIVATIGAAGLYFAGPHLGLNLPGLQK